MSEDKINSREITRLYKEYINPDLTRVIRITGLGVLEDHASGSRVWDTEGNEYLDMAGGYGVFCLGHSHPKIVEAVSAQLHTMPLSAKVFFSPLQAQLAEKLAAITPGDLKYTFFSNSGTEAVEAALKFARLATGRTGYVCTERGFHGKTTGGLAVSGRPNYRQPFEPLMPEVFRVPFGDVEAMRTVIKENVAAVILEPVQGEGGIYVSPDGYLQAVRQMCDEHGVLLIADEVQTGFGRTGKMFACQHWDVVPDILVVAKALGGGVMPIGATIGTPEVWKAFKGRPLIHTSTFGGNPLACAAGIATIDVLLEEGLPEKSAQSGAYMLGRLRELVAKYPEICAEARGLGLMLGIEFKEEKFGGSVISEMARHNIIAVYTLNQPKVIRFEPPLAIAREDIDFTVQALDESLAKTKQVFKMD